MRFMEGSRVEVLRKKKESYGCWVPARILWKDGCIYTVRYELLLSSKGEAVVEKVHEKDVRPCPSPVHEQEKWVFGDIAEVFDLHSWRVGKIAKVLNNNQFIVRLCGSVQLKKFHVSDLRVRRAWHNNQWIVLGKGSQNKQLCDSFKGIPYLRYEADHAKCEEPPTVDRHNQDYVCKLPPGRTVNKSVAIYNRSLRGDAVVRVNKTKRRLTSEVHEYHQPPKKLLPTKVDAPPFSRDTPLQLAEDSDACSVASCSSNDLAENTFQNTRKHSRTVASSFYDDDDTTSSSCPTKTGRGYPKSLSEHDLDANIHELELHAYKTTMQALYASGPLSWEQESLLTNLRLSLHISNEEHLHQLRYLLST